MLAIRGRQRAFDESMMEFLGGTTVVAITTEITGRCVRQITVGFSGNFRLVETEFPKQHGGVESLWMVDLFK